MKKLKNNWQKRALLSLLVGFGFLSILSGCTERVPEQVIYDEEKRWKSPGTRPYPKLPYPKFAFTATYECIPQEPLHGASGEHFFVRIIGDGKGHLVELEEQVNKDGKKEFIRNCLEDWQNGIYYQLVKDAATKKDIGWQPYFLSPDVDPLLTIFEPAFKQHSRRFCGVHPEPLGKKTIDGKLCRGWSGGGATVWFDENTGIEVECRNMNLSRLKEFSLALPVTPDSKIFDIPETTRTAEFQEYLDKMIYLRKK